MTDKIKDKTLAAFESHEIRRVYDEITERWYFSVIDIIRALEVSSNPRNYWKVLKSNLNKEGSQLVKKINQLKLYASDGKQYLTDCADVECIFRLIQSIPSKKVEPIKEWLAKVGYERIQDINDPARGLDRSREYWKSMGRSEKWIQQRMMGQETRNKLTDYWKESGVNEKDEFAILTNIIHKEWSDLTVQEHKKIKNLKSQNLRDHMNEAELIFTALAELSTRQIAESEQTKGFEENKVPAKKGGQIAKKARLELESKTKKSIITNENFLPKKRE